MTITANEVFLLNNKMGSIARQVQLGTLIQNAESVTEAEIAIADGKVLIGNASGVGAAKTLSGDVTVDRDGVTTIGAGAVDETMLDDTNCAVRLQRINVTAAALVAATSGVALLVGTAIPDNAVIKKVYYDVKTTFAGDGDDSSTIKIGLEDQDNDVVVAVAISNVANPWDAGIHDAIQDGAGANMIKLTAARQLAVTWTAVATDTTLSAGEMDVFVEWAPGS